jgi:antitoxin component YwqK of YwqJK toxin-antitoxin module
MRNKIMLFGSALLFITITSFSQTKQYLYYFDKNMNLTEQSKSIFNGIGAKEDSLFKLILFNATTKQLVLTEHFTDSSLKVSEGLFQSYFRNVSVELEGNYLEREKDGLWQEWDSLGHLIDSSVYNNGEKILEVHFGYHKNGKLDSFIVNNIKTNQLKKIYYDDSEKVVSEVNFEGQKGLEKVFENGSIIKSDSVFTRAEIEAYFPGGNNAWNQYIMNQIQRHSNELTNKDYGTCMVKFIVGIDGRVTNVEATTMQGTKLAEIAVSAVQYGPNWKPASQYGRLVKAYRIQPVSVTNPSQ